MAWKNSEQQLKLNREYRNSFTAGQELGSWDDIYWSLTANIIETAKLHAL